MVVLSLKFLFDEVEAFRGWGKKYLRGLRRSAIIQISQSNTEITRKLLTHRLLCNIIIDCA